MTHLGEYGGRGQESENIHFKMSPFFNLDQLGKWFAIKLWLSHTPFKYTLDSHWNGQFNLN